VYRRPHRPQGWSARIQVSFNNVQWAAHFKNTSCLQVQHCVVFYKHTAQLNKQITRKHIQISKSEAVCGIE